ncbi:hypothetical protein F4819DRAFT_506300 [Hypoxylon fuscum]|nr:hypothetical protein F4819DRAFT_506300 [Hypoxylon fuscum]
MATQSGYAFFLKPEVNGKMRVILDTCRDKVLKTGLSQYVLRETKAGSLQPELPKVIAQYTNPTAENGLHLKSCSSATKNGLTEDFLRPVAKPTDNNWVVPIGLMAAIYVGMPAIYISMAAIYVGMPAIYVGMADVSTCEIRPNLPESIKKGEEIGTVHRGGSTHCLLFRPGVNLSWVSAASPGVSKRNTPLRSELAYVYQ